MAASPRAVIAVGASAGGVTALQDFARGLPPDLPAAVLVVLHLPSSGVSALSAILHRAGRLPAEPARDAEQLVEGRIYTAVPDHHLVAIDSVTHLSRGPTENGHRPAVDALFRSVALEYGPKAIGIVLSGALDDGTAGLVSIKSRGGLAIVQDPAEAGYRGMPENALARAPVDHVLRAADMGEVLAKRLAETVPEWPDAPVAPIDEMENAIAVAASPERVGDTRVTGVARASGLTCPDCQGTLFALDGEAWRYRCRIGHAWTAQALLLEQSVEYERALWTALRALEDKRALAERLRDDAEAAEHDHRVRHYADQLAELAQAAQSLRDILYRGLAQPGAENTGSTASEN